MRNRIVSHLITDFEEVVHRIVGEIGFPLELLMMVHHLLLEELLNFQLDSPLLQVLEFDAVGADLHPIGNVQVVE